MAQPAPAPDLRAGTASAKFALALALLGPAAAASSADVSTILRLTSNYEYRGYTLSDNHMAVQANVDAAWSNGFFLGTWISSADFGGTGAVANPYFGKPFPLSPDWQVVTTVAAYIFNGELYGSNPSYGEGAIRLAYRDICALQLNFAPDYYGTGSTVPSYELELRYPLSDTIELSAGLGYQASRDALNYDGVFSNVGIAWYVLPDLTLDLRYHELHEMNEGPYDNPAAEPLSDHHLDMPVIFSIAVSL